MSKIFSFAIVFMLSFSIFSAEKAPVLIGRMDVPSLMSVTEDLSRISETVSPGSSIMLVMGLTALSFDPKMKDFDLTSHIGLYLYLFEKNNVPSVEWCAAFNKKTPGTLEKNDFGKNLFCKEFGSTAVLADSQELLDKLKELPPAPAAASEDDDEPGIVLSFNPEAYLKNCGPDYLNIKNDFLSQLSLKYHKAGDSGLMRSKATRVRMEYIEKFLSQISELKMRIRIKKDGVVFKMNLIPAADSQFSAFAAKQKGIKPELLPFAKDKLFVASGSFMLTDAIRTSASELFRDISFEISEDEKNNGYAEIVDAIAKSSSGKFSLFLDISKEKSWSDAVIKLQSSKDGMKNLNDIFSKKYSAMKTGTDRFYKISDVPFAENKSLKTLCLLSDADMLVYEGEATPADAMKIMNDGFKNGEPVGDEYDGCFFVLKSSVGSGDRSDEVTAFFKDNSAGLRIFITSDTIRDFIPPEYLSKQKKKEKKKKRANPM